MKLFLAKTTLVLLSTIIALGLLEFGLRFLGPPPASAPMIPDSVLHHVKIRNFTFRSYSPNDEFAPFIIYWDGRGLVADPEKKQIFDPSRHTRKIALLGDSFTEASQVPYANSFAGLLNQNAQSGVFFFNWGMAYCGPVIYYVRWKYDIKQTHPEHVFLELYENNIGNDEVFSKQTKFDADGLPIKVTAKMEPFLNWLRRSSLFRFARFAFLKGYFQIYPQRDATILNAGDFGELRPDISELTARMILALKKEIEASGAKLTILAVPSRRADLFGDPADCYPTFASKVATWCHDHEIDYIDLEKPFQEWRHNNGNAKLYFKRDIHWTAAAHRLVAEAIMARYPQYFSSAQNKK